MNTSFKRNNLKMQNINEFFAIMCAVTQCYSNCGLWPGTRP